MLGLGNTLTASGPIEGIIQIDGFTGLLCVPATDDENVLFAVAFNPSGNTVDALGYDSASTGDRLSGSFTLTITRVDDGDQPVSGATTTGTVYAYKSSTDVFYISDQNLSNIPLTDFGTEGSALIDITSFGDVTDITDNAETSNNYTATFNASFVGYTDSSQSLAAVASIDTA